MPHCCRSLPRTQTQSLCPLASPTSRCPAPQLGAVLLGGNATGGITGADDASVVAKNNTLVPQVLLVEQLPLVSTLTGIVTGLSEWGCCSSEMRCQHCHVNAALYGPARLVMRPQRLPLLNTSKECLARTESPTLWQAPRPATNLPAAGPSSAPAAAFDEPGFNLSDALSQAQGQLCSFLSTLDLAALPANMSSDVEGQLAAAFMKVRARGGGG